MSEQFGRKRGGAEKVNRSITSADRKRLETTSRAWASQCIEGERGREFLDVVKAEILSRAIHAHKGEAREKEITKEEMNQLSSNVTEEQVKDGARSILLHALLQQQHNIQLNGRTEEERKYRPDIATLTDAVRGLARKSLRKFIKTKSIVFLLEHHNFSTMQRIREMAGKEQLLKPVEFVAETDDPACYLGRLFYKGNYAKISLLEKNCVGTEDDYLKESKDNPETGRPTTEIFVVMKRWEHAGYSERESAVHRLLSLRGDNYLIFYRIENEIRRLQGLVSQEEAEKDLDMYAVKDEFIYQAVQTVLNSRGEPITATTIKSSFKTIASLVEKICKLSVFTDIPVITLEYNVPRGSVEQAKAWVGKEPNQPLSKNDTRTHLLLSALWGIARSERYNAKIDRWERRRIFSYFDHERALGVDEGDGGMLIKEARKPIRYIHEATNMGSKELLELLKKRDSSLDCELLGGTIVVDKDTPKGILARISELSVDVEIQASARQGQLDQIVGVNGVLVIHARVNKKAVLKNLRYAGEINDDNGVFVADSLVEMQRGLKTDAAECSVKNLRRAEEVELTGASVGHMGKMCFYAPNLQSGKVVFTNNRNIFEYDCPLPYTIELK